MINFNNSDDPTAVILPKVTHAMPHSTAKADTTPPSRQQVEPAQGRTAAQSVNDNGFLSDLDLHLFNEGTHNRIYEKLGGQLTTLNGVAGAHFAVWAPNAQKISVIGDFNGWDDQATPLAPVENSGIWAIFVPGATQGQHYKYAIWSRHGHRLPDKADPYAFYCQTAPETASILWKLPYRAPRESQQTRHDAISVYEVQLASWKRKGENEWLTYKELGEQLVPYVKEMGFTHIECLPVSEYPFSGSWGYQPIGLFAPTSRFGTPDDFADFVDAVHAAGLQLIIDWVPGHFPADIHGLVEFDGTHLYEHEDPREGRHMDWDTLIYNYGRTEVLNFLVANARFWMDRYGIDGLRVDAVASMIYRNYSRKEGEWLPNEHGGVENYQATRFLRRMNEVVFADYPHATTYAEESTSWPMVSHPTSQGGLGFGFKWNMGWMHDTLHYMSADPIHRQYEHHNMTFGLLYGFSENFILPLSHDEVVHGKGSLISRMPGDEWQQFANLRAYFGFMFGHPGKKLLFMGCEFAQRQEWKHDYSLDWHLLDYPFHQGVQTLVKDLNHLYQSTPALYRHDCETRCFEWLESDAAQANVLVFLRKGGEGEEPVIVVCNFSPVVREGYRVPAPAEGTYRELLNTDASVYGGSNVGNNGQVQAKAVPHHGRDFSLSLTLPPLATLFLSRQATLTPVIPAKAGISRRSASKKDPGVKRQNDASIPVVPAKAGTSRSKPTTKAKAPAKAAKSSSKKPVVTKPAAKPTQARAPKKK